MREQPIARILTKVLVPFILLFGLYVQVHGEISAGGGFQAGVILGAAIILYGLVFGTEAARKSVPPAFVYAGAAVGVLVYGGVGIVAQILGGDYLDYGVLASDFVGGQKLGITLVEGGVGLTVASVMIGVFYDFTGRRA